MPSSFCNEYGQLSEHVKTRRKQLVDKWSQMGCGPGKIMTLIERKRKQGKW